MKLFNNLLSYWKFIIGVKLKYYDDDWVYICRYNYYESIVENNIEVDKNDYVGYIRYSYGRNKLECYADKKNHQMYSKLIFPTYLTIINTFYSLNKDQKLKICKTIFREHI